jgi:hypothetical protein
MLHSSVLPTPFTEQGAGGRFKEQKTTLGYVFTLNPLGLENQNVYVIIP